MVMFSENSAGVGAVTRIKYTLFALAYTTNFIYHFQPKFSQIIIFDKLCFQTFPVKPSTTIVPTKKLLRHNDL